MSRSTIVIALLSSAATVSAGPMLLASYNKDASSGGGGGPFVDNFVSFALQLPTSPPFGPPVDPRVGVGAAVPWMSGSAGSAVFSVLTDPAAASFSSIATDGVDDWVGIYTPWGGYVQRESEVFGRAPDLIGNEVDRIELIVHEVAVIPLPDINGSMVTWNVTYNFYGTSIPEPTMCSMVALGAMVALANRRANRKSVVPKT